MRKIIEFSVLAFLVAGIASTFAPNIVLIAIIGFSLSGLVILFWNLISSS